MPANSKYLNRSPFQRFAKISAGLLGGYIISALFHMSLALWMPMHKAALITSIITHFILWAILLIIPFLFNNGWKSWLLYICVILVLYIIFYLGNQHNPFI